MNTLCKVLTWCLLGLLAVIFSPIWIPMAIYELTPQRRQAVYKFETTILTVLARLGTTKGRTLRLAVEAELKRKYGSPLFYTTMARFEDDELVEAWNEPGEIRGVEVQTRYYRLTEGGRRQRVKMSMLETVKTLRGRLLPAPA